MSSVSEREDQGSRRPARKRASPPRLDRTQVAETGLRLLNETGLEGLSLRRIAKELNVQAPALYWHFDSKQALLDEMATLMTRELRHAEYQVPQDAGWDEWFAESLRVLRRALLRYRDGAKVFSGTRMTTTEHGEGQELYLRMMTQAGFPVNAAARAFFTAFSYTIGFVIEEQAVQPLPGERTEGYDPAERAARMAAFPLAAQISADLFTDYDARFEEGLRAVIEGLRATVLRAPSS
ncbi:TetR/AcrR family transcriptional regulator C-terminal domain-containing protein [Streptomyces reniochalinae]|uniref:TetR family transcriptional regulator n=1 Tax=Streptomyces reniochalinae TaxID=2250578 RepID=A0A367EMW3_9ACTN|nr:TetR/AcrR family transcriptional regulator C-terminal domain-containing protein [Streptomyces reniochalinae]RCG19313.1 TetR family transcriptional regulator [Streptomyces reniochalinae]